MKGIVLIPWRKLRISLIVQIQTGQYRREEISNLDQYFVNFILHTSRVTFTSHFSDSPFQTFWFGINVPYFENFNLRKVALSVEAHNLVDQ